MILSSFFSWFSDLDGSKPNSAERTEAPKTMDRPIGNVCSQNFQYRMWLERAHPTECFSSQNLIHKTFPSSTLAKTIVKTIIYSLVDATRTLEGNVLWIKFFDEKHSVGWALSSYIRHWKFWEPTFPMGRSMVFCASILFTSDRGSKMKEYVFEKTFSRDYFHGFRLKTLVF